LPTEYILSGFRFQLIGKRASHRRLLVEILASQSPQPPPVSTQPDGLPRVTVCDHQYRRQDPDFGEPAWDSPLLDAISPATFHPQQQSPLFGKLSSELRDQVFALALAEYEDWSREYFAADEGADPARYCEYIRPGWYAPWRVDWALLLTCRRAYHEAAHLPMRQAVHRLCLGAGAKPRNDGQKSDYMCLGRVRLEALTRHNLQNVTELCIQADPHLLTGLDIYVSWWESVVGPDAFPNLECLTLIVAWNAWFPAAEVGELDLDAMSAVTCWPEVKKRLTLELEAGDDERDRARLKALVREMRRALKLTTINGTPLVPAPRWRSYRWLFEAPDGVLGGAFAEYRHLVNEETEMLVAVCDFVPGRRPALWKDIRDEQVYGGRRTGNDISSNPL